MGTELVTHIRKPKVAKNKLSKTEHYILASEDEEMYYEFQSTESKVEKDVREYLDCNLLGNCFNTNEDHTYTLYKAIGSVIVETQPVVKFKYDE